MHTFKWILTVTLMLVSSSVFAQMLEPKTQTLTTNDRRLETAHHMASQSIAAFRTNDFQAYVRFIHPVMIKDAGGRETMVQITRHSKVTLDEQTDGYDTSVKQPTRLIQGTENLYTIVPQKVTLQLKSDQTINRDSYLLGVSGDNGRTWKFVDGGTDAAKIRQLFPDFPANERLPNEPQR